jgi:phosphatidylglycerol lysyltransferase
MKPKRLHSLGPLFGLLLFAVALWVLHHELKAYHLKDILCHLHELPAHRLFLALLLTVLSYLTLTCYDTLAVRYIQRPIPYGKTALASFIGYSFSNNTGFSMIAGASVRYRLYSTWGLSTFEITRLVAFCTLTFWLGFFTIAGGVFLSEPMMIPGALHHLPFASVRPIGAIFLMFVVSYVLVTMFRKKPLVIRDWKFNLPSVRLLVVQLAVASLDWIIAGGVLYTLLPDSPRLSFMGFMSIFLLAQMAGLASQVPGGLGILETVVIVLLPSSLPASEVLGSLLAYRGIYYILPLLTAALLLGTQEILNKKVALQRVAGALGRQASVLVPQVLAFSTFVGGAILLFSGAMPSVNWRLSWLKNFIPLPVIEISHFLGSLAGVGLLVLARGLQRRIDAAYIVVAALLGTGILVSLLKGLDYEEAIALSVMLVALLPCHSYFYRKSSIISQRFNSGWIAGIALVLLCSIWLGLFSYKHVEYSRDLWWRFALYGDAPRFLRAMVGAIGAVFFLVMARLLSPAHPEPESSQEDDLARALPVVRASDKTYANLALLGDKTFLFSENGNAFIMYAIEGRSWISMRDPVGDEGEWAELVWRYREMCDRYDGWPVFYQVGTEKLHLYVDLGLTPLKLGEEGRVPLERFSLEGSGRKGLRYTARRLEKEGCIFEMIPPEGVSSVLPDLKRISDAWLAEKNTGEKGFSLGFFDTEYLKRLPAAIVRRDGAIVAFINIWSGRGKEELSIDLLRYSPTAPHGVMEYLFIQLMLWGKRERYRWFNLGMAPFSGFEDRSLSPLWDRLGAFVYSHGEHFYNLRGLRQYKEKFDPEWRPKYLASPGGLALPRILANIASLISGGMKSIITK